MLVGRLARGVARRADAFREVYTQRSMRGDYMLSILVACTLLAAPTRLCSGPCAGSSLRVWQAETTIYDANGDAAAYIAADDLTIYLWGGKPVAYLVGDRGAYSTYGFNGSHLGWLEDGIVRDHSGDAVGFLKGAVAMVTGVEPLKGLKELRPLKSLRELAPLKPLYSQQFSRTPLSLFLAAGAD